MHVHAELYPYNEFASCTHTKYQVSYLVHTAPLPSAVLLPSACIYMLYR
jgi:hypothetical protein